MAVLDENLRRVALALDTSDWPTFVRWCRFFGPRVGVLKVGLEAFTRWGNKAVEIARRDANELFLDLKLHDIPNTVGGAVAAARDLGADYLTVHSSGGSAMLAAARAEADNTVRLLAVTLLTHLDREALVDLDLPGDSHYRIKRWAALARRAGCAGVVCSPLEAADLRSDNPRPFLLVTPGIRTGESRADDQRRIATPAAAIEAGADLLVIGRPITRAADPELALESIASELRQSGEPPVQPG
jgi:orotidine-5'-phosphate decarboxylase